MVLSDKHGVNWAWANDQLDRVAGIILVPGLLVRDGQDIAGALKQGMAYPDGAGKAEAAAGRGQAVARLIARG
jgi:hypothetical protein